MVTMPLACPGRVPCASLRSGNIDGLAGPDHVDVPHIGIEAFENAQEITKILVGDLPLLTENLKHPVPRLHDVGFAQNVPTAVVTHQVVLVDEAAAVGGTRAADPEQQNAPKRQRSGAAPLRGGCAFWLARDHDL
jgi:hypothetical protein